jgi:predicted O-linked N-acetylglucosamine transferase (SPINDLY family)
MTIDRKALPPRSRTAPCPCGSGRRYKDCHGRLEAESPRAPRAASSPDDGELRALMDDALAHQKALRSHEAETLYRSVLARAPDTFDALHMLGTLRHQAGDHDAAIDLFRRAIAVNADHAPVHSNLALALTATRAYDEALASVDRALALAPRYPEALNNRGLLLGAQSRYADALQCFDAALALTPDHPELLSNRGNALMELRRNEEAAQCFARLVELAPDHPWALGYLYQTRMQICDWTGLDALRERIDAGVRAGRRVITPFAYLAASGSPADQLRCAQIQAARPPAPISRPATGLRYGHDRIRIAYISADFREHPSSQLMARLYETHDRSRFDVTGISLGPDNDDAMRRRVARAFDRFIDVGALTDHDVAALLRDHEIDIAIDLMGYTNNGRPGILERRGAAVQVNYLGYPGTLGTDRSDYIFADAQVIPPADDVHYVERVVRLPDTYYPHDPTRAVGQTPSRASVGLRDDAFVFCCFNNNYKIMPATYDLWMRLLARVDGSVLWLLAPDEAARRNLRAEAARRCVDAARIVFAPHVPVTAHLARQRLADLFLDTHFYNAHTAAVDALWVGLPVLTYPGTTFAGRVAASVLRAAGLPELVARDSLDYETRALELARAPAVLRAIRERLERERDMRPLFDFARFRAAIEAAYATMWSRNEAGLPPAAFDVRADGTTAARS